jgi:hypothetical protein
VLSSTLRRLARVWAGSVYAAMVPVVEDVPTGASHFLEDLWKLAPWRVAFPSTVGVLLVAISPLVAVRRAKLFHQLVPAERDRVLSWWMEARLYVARLLFFAVKSQALLAVLRDERVRAVLGLEDGV